MKKTNLFILLMACMLGSIITTSCKKSFLEKPKGGSITVDTIFDTKNQAQYAISQMYLRCVRSYFAANYNMCRPDDLTDELYIIHPDYDWASGNNSAGDYITGNMATDYNCDWRFGDDGPSGFAWHYTGIRQANLVLQNIDKVKDADATWISQVKGEALFCRAIQHYELFRLYGGIPIVTVPLDGNGNVNVPRSSLATTVDSIVSWCDQAAHLLPPTRSASEYGHATSLAALALKARVLLFAASPLYNTPPDKEDIVKDARFHDDRDSVLCYPNYDKERWNTAYLASKAVLTAAPASSISFYSRKGIGQQVESTGETLDGMGDYESVSNVYANSELILVATQNMQMVNGGWSTGTAWGDYLYSKLRLADWGVKNNVPIEFMEQYQKRDGSKFTLPKTGSDLPVDIVGFNLDPRFYQTVAYDGMYYNADRGTLPYYKKGDYPSDGTMAGSDAGVDGYAMETYKFVARAGGFDDTRFAWPVFRLTEFYLSAAEALNEYSGPTSEALGYLNNWSRKRAGMPAETPSTAAEFRADVHNERTIEFAYENFRYNDLNRWLESTAVLNGPLHGIQTTARNVGGALKRTWEQVLFVTRIFPGKYYYVPFPSGEISKRYLGNESWDGQNPGW